MSTTCILNRFQRLTIRYMGGWAVFWSLLLVLLAVVELLLVVVVAYTWRSKRQALSTTVARPHSPAVSWRAGRWDVEPRHASVANVGDVTACEVSVTEDDRVVGRAERVPPYRADRLSSSAELLCYVDCCLAQRLQRMAVGPAKVARNLQTVGAASRVEVKVRVRWRSDLASGSPKPSVPTDRRIVRVWCGGDVTAARGMRVE